MYNISVGILNGGKSERMGTPKSLLGYKNTTLIEYIYNEALKITENIYILGNAPLPPSMKNTTILEDRNFKGPLGGFTALSDKYKGSGIFLWAVDMPLLTSDDINCILSKSDNLTKPVIPYNNHDHFFEVLFAYYPTDTIQQITNTAYTRNIESIQRILTNLKINGNTDIYANLATRLKSWNYPIDIIL